jgi:hypothetical protein
MRRSPRPNRRSDVSTLIGRRLIKRERITHHPARVDDGQRTRYRQLGFDGPRPDSTGHSWRTDTTEVFSAGAPLVLVIGAALSIVDAEPAAATRPEQ